MPCDAGASIRGDVDEGIHDLQEALVVLRVDIGRRFFVLVTSQRSTVATATEQDPSG